MLLRIIDLNTSSCTVYPQMDLERAERYLDVKADMESDRPMDRLVCGDVGFGKTEVAVRAEIGRASCRERV